MSASRDARRADIQELVPGLAGERLEAAVDLWCQWFSERVALDDIAPDMLRTFKNAIDTGDSGLHARSI